MELEGREIKWRRRRLDGSKGENESPYKVTRIFLLLFTSCHCVTRTVLYLSPNRIVAASHCRKHTGQVIFFAVLNIKSVIQIVSLGKEETTVR